MDTPTQLKQLIIVRCPYCEHMLAKATRPCTIEVKCTSCKKIVLKNLAEESGDW